MAEETAEQRQKRIEADRRKEADKLARHASSSAGDGHKVASGGKGKAKAKKRSKR